MAKNVTSENESDGKNIYNNNINIVYYYNVK